MAQDSYLDDNNNPYDLEDPQRQPQAAPLKWDTPADWMQNTNGNSNGSDTGGAPPAPAAPQQNTYDRTQFRDASMSRAAGESVAAFLQRMGGGASGVSLLAGSQDKVRLPSGEVMDLAINSNNGVGANGWTGMGQQDEVGGAIRQYTADNGGWWGGGPGTGASASSGSTNASSYKGLSPEDLAKKDEIFNRLMSKAGQSTDNLKDDPNVRQASDAYAANEERAKRNYLADTAERNGPYANMQGEERLAAERVGQRTGMHESDLVQQELTARRAEIMQSLQTMGSLLSDQQKMSLTSELANIDNQFKYAQLGQQGNQFDKSLAQSGQQFNDNLGFNIADREAYWNNAALNNLM